MAENDHTNPNLWSPRSSPLHQVDGEGGIVQSSNRQKEPIFTWTNQQTTDEIAFSAKRQEAIPLKWEPLKKPDDGINKEEGKKMEERVGEKSKRKQQEKSGKSVLEKNPNNAKNLNFLHVVKDIKEKRRKVEKLHNKKEQSSSSSSATNILNNDNENRTHFEDNERADQSVGEGVEDNEIHLANEFAFPVSSL